MDEANVRWKAPCRKSVWYQNSVIAEGLMAQALFAVGAKPQPFCNRVRAINDSVTKPDCSVPTLFIQGIKFFIKGINK